MIRKPFRADLHVHTHHSKDSLANPKDVLKEAVKKGMSAIAITDHDEISGAFETARVAKAGKFPIQVIIGEEVRCNEGDLLVYFLKKRIAPGSLSAVLREAKKQGAVCCVAHPYDFARHAICLGQLGKSAIRGIDAIEVFNARNPLESMNRQARNFADSFGKAAFAGSDAHHPSEVGTAHIEFLGVNSLDPHLLLSAKRKVCGTRSHPFVRFYTRYAALKKKLVSMGKGKFDRPKKAQP